MRLDQDPPTWPHLASASSLKALGPNAAPSWVLGVAATAQGLGGDPVQLTTCTPPADPSPGAVRTEGQGRPGASSGLLSEGKQRMLETNLLSKEQGKMFLTEI